MTAGVDEPLEVVVEVAPGPYAAGLLGRALGAIAARFDLPLDRLDDALLAIDALCDQAAPDRVLRVRVAGMEGEVWLHVGPLQDDEAGELLEATAIPGGPPLLPSLADGARLADDGLVALTFAARR